MTLLKDLRLIKRSFVQENQHFIVQQFQNNLQYGTIFWTKARNQAKNAKRGLKTGPRASPRVWFHEAKPALFLTIIKQLLPR